MIECTLYYLVKDNINKVLTLSLTPATGTIGTEYFCASSFTTFITHSAWATFFLYSSHLKLSSHRESGLHLLFWLKLLILPHLVWMPWSLGCVIVISAAIFSPIHLRVLTHATCWSQGIDMCNLSYRCWFFAQFCLHPEASESVFQADNRCFWLGWCWHII